MRVHLVRHACAGRKEHWSGPDDLRPLDRPGRVQAEALAALLVGDDVSRLVSSTSVRCVETLEPLAGRLGLPVHEAKVLAVGVPLVELEAYLAEEGSAGAVLCTHGEVMRPLLQHLRDGGTEILGERTDEEWLTAKGTAWTMEYEAEVCVRLEHRAPAGLLPCADHV